VKQNKTIRLIGAFLSIAAFTAPSAEAVSVSATRTGSSVNMSFTWNSDRAWSGGTMKLSDTAADSKSVQAQIEDNGQTESTKDCNAGNGNSCTFNSLAFTRTNQKITFIKARACVAINFWPDACTYGNQVVNPAA
jgi:hypothetical protein